MNLKTAIRDNKYCRLAFIAGLVIVLDQISKIVIVNTVPIYHSVSVIPGCFDITYILNPGGAFGFLAGHSSQLRLLVFVVLSSLAAGLVFYFYIKTPQTHRWLSVGFALIFGGAVGNLIDRIRFGKVVDFLDFYVGNLHWPAFNLADSAITIGMGIFVFHFLLNKMPE